MKFFTLLFPFVLLLSGAVSAQSYCMLPGRTSYSPLQPGITKFKLNNVERVSLSVEGPLNVPPVSITGDTIKLSRGETYTVTIEHNKDGVNFPMSRNNIRVWLDYNQNFLFTELDETIIKKDFETAGTFTATFTVPLTAPLGFTRLRATAKMSSDAGHTIPTPCDEPADPIDYHGEMEDYTVLIQAPAGIKNVVAGSLPIAVYPNPVTNEFTVSFDAAGQEVIVELYDVAGKKIVGLYNGPALAGSKYSFNLKDYVQIASVYFIKAMAGENTSYQKIINVD